VERINGGKKMSKTIENLKQAFAGEAQARNKYTYYAKIARNEGYHYIAKLFEETAENELQHAKDEFKFLGELGDTKKNLRAAMEGEHHEEAEMYPRMAKEAREEGREDVAKLFDEIAQVEKHHEERFRKLLELVEKGTVYKRDQPIKWKCSKCGYIHEGEEPPEKCPSCKHPKEYYEPANLEF